MENNRRKCENLIKKGEDIVCCSRYATHVIRWQDRDIEYVCTQHAHKMEVAHDVQIIEMQGTR